MYAPTSAQVPQGISRLPCRAEKFRFEIRTSRRVPSWHHSDDDVVHAHSEHRDVVLLSHRELIRSAPPQRSSWDEARVATQSSSHPESPDSLYREHIQQHLKRISVRFSKLEALQNTWLFNCAVLGESLAFQRRL